jgi:hypothetical protein
MKFEIGDILLVDGQVWTVIEKKRGRPIVLQCMHKIMSCFSYELEQWITETHKDSIHYPVIK